MRVLGFGTYDVRTHPRVGVLLSGLRSAGMDVVELNRPLGIGTSGRVAALHSPSQLLTFATTLLARWASLVVGSLRFMGAHRPDVVLVGYMGHFDVLLARLLFPRARIVLDHLIFAADTAKDRGSTGALINRILGALDRTALGVADIVVLDTPAHRDMVPARMRDKCVVVPVGAPRAWFDARRPAADVSTPLSIVFFGLFTPLQGTPVIAQGLRAAASEGSLRITMIGSGQDLSECQEILSDTPVTWIEWVEAEDLPELVASHDVCLGIMGTTPKAMHVVPNKVFQGMAAGCAVITSDTPPQRELLGDTVVWCPPGDDAALSTSLLELSRNRDLLVRGRRRAADRADAAFGPDEVVTPLVEALR